MGDIADYLEHVHSDHLGNGDTDWVMGNGEVIAAEDMTDSHLLNTIRMVKRSTTVFPDCWAFLLNEADKRGLSQ